MREIEFRGKALIDYDYICDAGDWIYGGISTYDDNVWIINYNEQLILVDPETVGQYTGKNDFNGVKAFDGDTINRTHDDVSFNPSLWRVYWDEDFSQWRQNGKQYGSQRLLSTSRHYKQEIIGNIYEGRL